MLCSTPNGKDGEESPIFDSSLADHVSKLMQMGEVSLVDTGHDIPNQILCLCQEPDGSQGILETHLMASHPVVFFLESVQTDGDAPHAGLHQALQPLFCEQHAITDDSPGIFPAVKFPSDILDILTDEWFTSRNVDHQLVSIHVGADAVDHMQEILSRHVGNNGILFAVASAMQAMEVASKRTFPKELMQGMQFRLVVTNLPFYFQA